jgi:uncharacterized membrane protein
MRRLLARHLRAHAARFGRARRGNFATLTALTMPLLFMFAAFAIDEGSLFLERRELQSLADLAAIQAAADIGNAQAVATSMVAGNVPAPEAAAEPTQLDPAGLLEGSGFGLPEIVTGRYEADPALDPASRFVAGAAPVNAVRVKLSRVGTRYFAGQLIAPPAISATATAATMPEAAFTIGSRLARLDAGMLNALLGALTGSEVSLSLMDYEALASADVSLLDMLDAFRTEANVTAVTYADLLGANASAGQLATALRKAGGLQLRAGTAVEQLARALPRAGQTFTLSRLLDLGSYDGLPVGTRRPGSEPRAAALDLLSAAILLAAAGGDHQVELGLDAAAAGLAGLSLTLTIGEPPQGSPPFRLGQPGASVGTAQLRLGLRISVGVPPTKVQVPITLELAPAEARIADIACPTAGSGTPAVTIEARPGLVTANIGEARQPASGGSPVFDPATLLDTPLLRITGRAGAEIANRRFTALRFDGTDIERGTVKRVSTRDITASLAKSLIADLRLQASGLGALGGDAAKATVVALLSAAAPAIDATIDSLLAALGISLGEADIRVTAASCGRPVLVQ